MPPGDESWWMSDVPEPVLDGRLVSFILFGDEEPDELGVTHARVVAVGVVVARSDFGQFVLRCAARDGAREYPVDHPRTDGCANQMERFQTKSHAERERVDAGPHHSSPHVRLSLAADFLLERTAKAVQHKQIPAGSDGPVSAFCYWLSDARTVIVVTGQIFLVDEQIVILVQFPELAVDDVKVFVAEEIRDLIDVVLVLQQPDGGQQVRVTQFRQADVTRPGAVDVVEDASDNLCNV